MKRFLAVCMLLLPWSAQATIAGADFLSTEIPARPAGMAGAFAAYHDDATAFLWNPAALAYTQDPSVSATQFNSIVDTTFDQASYIQPLNFGKTAGGLGLGVQYDTTSNLVETDLQGNNLGEIDNHDLVLQTGYGFMLGPQLSLGLGLKGFSSQLAEYQSEGYAVDLGMQSVITSRLDLGISFVNLGEEEAYDSQSDPLPAMLRIALRWLMVDSPEVMIQSGVEIDKPWTTSDPILVDLGAEYWLEKIIAFRAGWIFGADTGNLTLGAGIKWNGLSFDYAYVDMGDIGISQRFSISAELGPIFEKMKHFVPEMTTDSPPSDGTKHVTVSP
jgi:hypothetical protein